MNLCLGVLGQGAYGRFLVESWRGLPGVEVVAIAGRNAERVRAAAAEMGVQA